MKVTKGRDLDAMKRPKPAGHARHAKKDFVAENGGEKMGTTVEDARPIEQTAMSSKAQEVAHLKSHRNFLE